MYKAFSARAIGFPETAERALPLAARAGFEGYWFDIREDVGEDVQSIRALLDSNGMKASGFNLPVDFRGPELRFEEDLASLPALADRARRLGLDRCITWIAPASDELAYRENFERHTARLRQAAQVLFDRGVRLGLEFVGPPSARRGRKHGFVHTLEETLELCEAIGLENMGVLLDVWHWDLAGQRSEDFAKIPDESRIVLVHLNDAPKGIPAEEQQDQTRTLPGATGVLRISAFMQGLQDIGYSGPVVVEPFDAELKRMSLSDAVVATKAALDRVWPEQP